MAQVGCRCGSRLSGTSVPSEYRLVVFFEHDWIEKTQRLKELAGSFSTMPWYCPKCGRIYDFDKDGMVVEYIIEKRWNADDTPNIGDISEMSCVCGNKFSENRRKIIAYTEIEYDKKTTGIKLISELQKPERDVWYCPECERIYVFENRSLKKRYVIANKRVDTKLIP